MKWFRKVRLSTKLLASAVFSGLVALFLTGLTALYVADRRWGFGAYFFATAVVNASFAWKGWMNGHRERREDDQRRAGGGPHSLAGANAGTLGANPYAGEGPRVNDFEVPDSATPILGWRTWAVKWDQNEPVLAASTRPCIWPTREKLTADCIHTDEITAMAQVLAGVYGVDLQPRHGSSPDSSCICGIYALKEWDEVFLYGGSVFGEVKLWGKVIEGTKGYRAEFAYPSRLWIKLPRRPELPKFEAIDEQIRSSGISIDEPLSSLYDTYCQRVQEEWENKVGKRIEIAARISESYGVPCVPLFRDHGKSWPETVSTFEAVSS